MENLGNASNTKAGIALKETQVKLFTPLKIRDLVIKNRLWVSPMCQYSSTDGMKKIFIIMIFYRLRLMQQILF